MKKLFVILMLLSANVLLAQEKCEFRLSLRDGSIISGKSVFNKVSLSTPYGKLEIPIKNVSAIEMGLPKNKDVGDKVNNLMKQLYNESETIRKSGYDEMIKLGIEAIPAVNDFIYSSTYEAPVYTDYTPEGILSDLKSTYGIVEEIRDKDIVTIDYEYVMGGFIEFPTMKLATAYGNLEIPREKIEKIEVMYVGGDEGDKTFKLMASKHISSNNNGGWLKTGIMIKSGQSFSITASGEVTLASLSNAKYTPNGAANSATTDTYAYDTSYPAYGNVVYKIGDNGVAMKAGGSFKGTANTSGMLFISIYETVYNSANTGSYTVKIKL